MSALEMNTILSHVVPHVAPDYADGLRQLTAKAESEIKDCAANVRRIQASGEYTAEGKRLRTTERCTIAAARLEEIAKQGEGYRKNAEQLREQIRPRKRDGDATLQYMQEHEARAMLLQRYSENSTELQIEYERACRGEFPNSDLIAEAVENSPLPLLPAEVIEAGQEARAHRQSPKEAKKLSELLRLHRALGDIMAAGRAELERLGLAKDDPTARIAAGDAA